MHDADDNDRLPESNSFSARRMRPESCRRQAPGLSTDAMLIYSGSSDAIDLIVIQRAAGGRRHLRQALELQRLAN